MDNFISAIRTDRLREMREYEERGFTFIDKAAYRKIVRIEVLQEGYELEYGVEATQNDVYFYIIDKQANTYLSLYEIYELLLEMVSKEGERFVADALKRQQRLKIRKSPSRAKGEVWLHREKFLYKSVEYNIRETVQLAREGEVQIPDMALTISYRQLFLLMNLIQEKSNALFLKGREGKKYADGILRLFTVLLTKHGGDTLLEELGWQYDGTQDKFLFEPPRADTGRKRRKYYLTKQEYENIMK